METYEVVTIDGDEIEVTEADHLALVILGRVRDVVPESVLRRMEAEGRKCRP